MSDQHDWPVSLEDARQALKRIRPHLPPTPLRNYRQLDDAIGHDIRVLVKHENHNPTNSFKVRNGLSALTALSPTERELGVVAGTRGNHGQGLAWAGQQLGVPVILVIPEGNNPEKNASMRALGAELIVTGSDYDDAVAMAERLRRERGLHLVHSTNNFKVLAGATTISLEMLEEASDIDAIVVSVGGGSQAVGALTVARELKPQLEVHGVQAAAAPTIHDSWHAGQLVATRPKHTIADGLDTREIYAYTFPALRDGLTDFNTVSEVEIAEAIRLFLRTTHNLAEGAGAAGLAGLLARPDRFAGKTVGVILGGSNIDTETLQRVLSGEL
jgi:threonine dehydratase